MTCGSLRRLTSRFHGADFVLSFSKRIEESIKEIQDKSDGKRMEVSTLKAWKCYMYMNGMC